MLDEPLKCVAALKSGNRQDAKECLEIAARGLIKTHYQLRPMDTLTKVSYTRVCVPVVELILR